MVLAVYNVHVRERVVWCRDVSETDMFLPWANPYGTEDSRSWETLTAPLLTRVRRLRHDIIIAPRHLSVSQPHSKSEKPPGRQLPMSCCIRLRNTRGASSRMTCIILVAMYIQYIGTPVPIPSLLRGVPTTRP
ncbi:hypothetical protein LY76DRAFT_319435 [Colletotrichum caudatum]|nr:hypothetical protein LY76DRAFT_319435 [Colletotrichum caudatum]